MECRFEVGDCVMIDRIKGEVIDVVDIGGECFLKVDTPGGNLVVPCEDARPCANSDG